MTCSKAGQRLIGCFMVAVGVPFIVYGWQEALAGGGYKSEAAALFPCSAVGGLGLILFPVDYDRLLAEHGVDRIEHAWHLPGIWKVWSAVTITAAAANWYALARTAARAAW